MPSDPSEFDDFMASGFDEASAIFGTEKLVITGGTYAAPLEIDALVNELGTKQELELNGRRVTFSAVVEAAAAQIRADPQAGQVVLRKKTGRSYLIVGEVTRDSLTVQFALDTVHA